MPLTCPACRKYNQVVSATSASCLRCGCDLSRLRHVQLAAIEHRRAATQALRLGQWADALDCAERAWWLLQDPRAARLAALASAALGQTETLLTWRHRARSPLPKPGLTPSG
jgi:hypothetical protein